jgi:hypothetical protein
MVSFWGSLPAARARIQSISDSVESSDRYQVVVWLLERPFGAISRLMELKVAD